MSIYYSGIKFKDELKPFIEIGDKNWNGVINYIDYDKNTQILNFNDNNIVVIINNNIGFFAVGSPVRYLISYLMGLIEEYNSVDGNIKSFMINYKKNDKIYDINEDVEDAKIILRDCLERLLERGEKIEIMETKTQELQDRSAYFKSITNKLSWNEYWKSIQCQVIGGGVAILIITTSVTGIILSII